MDVENVKLVDGLIFGYLGRRQYHETLRSFCNEAPSLRDGRHRFESGGDVFIQVNDQLHDKNLEQIVNAFAVVGRFDVSPELVDFGIRLRDLTNEFSTMTAVRGRTVSDNQMKLYGKRVFSKQPSSRVSQHSHRDSDPQKSQQFVTTYCAPQSGDQTVCSITTRPVTQPLQSLQHDYTFDYQSQPDASSYIMPNSSSYTPVQMLSQTSAVSSDQGMPADSTISYLTTDQTMPPAQPPASCEQPMLIDYGVDAKGSHSDVGTSQRPRTEASEDCNNAPHTHLSSSFSSESGAHKRKAAVPHRRDELVAQTAQSLIVPNGVLLDLESDAAANSASHASLLSHIDDSAMQCLDRLINGNLDEVFPFCDDHDNLSGFAAGMESSFHANQSSGNTYQQEGTGDLFSESAPPPLDVGPSHSPPPPEVVHSSKSRSIDEGEIISEESLHGRTERTASLGKIVTRSDDHEINTGREHSPVPRSDSRRSSLDSGRSRRDERKVADRLKDFSRNPPKSDHRSRKSTADRAELKDAVIFESGNVPRVHTPSTTGSRLSRERTRGFSSLFEEGHSNPSSRDSSPHREKLSRKEEERRRREKEMEKERQRDKERLKRQRRDRHRDGDHPSRHSPDRKSEKKTYHGVDEEKARDAREKEKKRELDEEKARDAKEKEKKREQVEERRVLDEAEKKKAEEKSRRELVKKKKEEEVEARRQAELQRRADAMRRKEEEDKRRRQEEKERQDEKRREEERRRIEEEKKRKRDEELFRRDDEKIQRSEGVSNVGQEDSRKEIDENRKEANSEASDGQETAKSTGHSDQESGSSDEDNTCSADVAHPVRNDEEMSCNRKDSRSQEQKTRNPKTEQRKTSETINRQAAERDGPPESEDDVAPVSESEERKKKSREETRPTKGSGESRKPPPPPIPARRREEQKKVAVKPLEPGMMMSDPGVLDRINKEMESLTPSSRNRLGSNRSPEEPSSSVKSLPSTRIPKRETPVDYNQVLFSNPPVIKRTPPAVEKKKNYVISSGLPTENANQLVFSKAHSSRLGMFLEKVSDKHKRLMERENDRATASPAYEDSDRNGVPSPVGFPHFPRQQQQKFAPQKRPLPATSLDSYLGSPPQKSPDIRDGEATSSRGSGKKCKLDLSKMPDIINKLYGEK